MLFLLRFPPQLSVRNYDIRNTFFLQLWPKEQVFLAITFLKNDEIRLVKRSFDRIKCKKIMEENLIYAIDLLIDDVQQSHLMPQPFLSLDVFRNHNTNSAERIIIYCGNVKNDHFSFLLSIPSSIYSMNNSMHLFLSAEDSHQRTNAVRYMQRQVNQW